MKIGKKSKNIQDLRGPTAAYTNVSQRMRKYPEVQTTKSKKLGNEAGLSGIGKTKRKK